MSTTRIRASIAIAVFVLLVNNLYAQEKNDKRQLIKVKPIAIELSDNAAFFIAGKKITLGEAIKMVLEQNRDTLTGSYDVAMTDSLYRKYQKKYSPTIDLKGGTRYQEYPEAMGWTMVGKDQKAWDVSAEISKLFQSGTKLSAGIRHEYAKTSFKPIVIPGLGEIPPFGDPEYHRPIMFISLQQELLKNFFGYSERRQQEILRNTGTMQRDTLIYQLSGLVVEAVVDYWTVIVNISNLDNAELQLRETINVRNIIAQNVRLGLAERFDLNYYNTLVAGAEARATSARQQYRDSLRNLLTTLNLDEDIDLSGNAILSNKLSDIDETKALKSAYAKRADYRNSLLNLRNAKLELEIYENEALPLVSAEFNWSSMGQMDEISDAYSDASSAQYPSWEARVKVTYPLDDSEQKINERNARYKLEQAKLQLEKYKRLVRDDIFSKTEHIKTNYELYQKAEEARIQAETYYRRLLASLRRGRFTAAVVKNGLDAMVESRQRELETLILYNVSLLQLDVSRNELFERYNIDVNKYIPKDRND
jgi:outer membrane protein TolC